ncbi:BLOC-1-related complex subunit 6 isoform X2 [Nilaparvata lugens]|nr:BLOC-1-related complex subunit 6 isoform X2 [Nilaparvata lugens]XP_022204610.2 BLOC-1-related complex subunit 6 isoform X2 [Nilaparvata lugens]XP_039298399.1 BLOC-1-related complex subunit 6 isoform X2 [Nilaparvata lugens]XP_039298400.1 BLOC-1-related complex subunit 6 isoform X2 [Nilaparvata lugens]
MTASYSEISFNNALLESKDCSEHSNKLCTTQGAENVVKPEEINPEHKEYQNERPKNLKLINDLESNVIEKQSASHKAFDYLNQLNGTVTQEGDMVLFVAEDLENKIKLSSPVSKKDPLSSCGWESTTSSWLKQSFTGEIPVVDITILNDLETEVSKIATSVDSLTENLAEILHSISALTVDCLETYRDVVCKTCDSVDVNIKSMYQLMAKCEELGKAMASIYKLSDHIKEIKHFLDLFENVAN